MRYFPFVLFLFLFGCDKPTDKILVAENSGSKDILGSNKTTLVLQRDLNYTLVADADNRFKGKVVIKNDTLFFDNKIFKKAILKNGYIEFLDFFSYKIKIIKNRTMINSGSSLDDLKDVTFFTYSKSFNTIFPSGIQNDLTKTDIIKIQNSIQDQIAKHSNQFSDKTNQSEYYKQCVSIKNRKNEKEVWVNCIYKGDSFLTEHWRTGIISVDDGGASFFNLKINLSTGAVYDFSINGFA